MTDSHIPKVGDTVSTYKQLKALPSGSVLNCGRTGWGLRFVQHDGDTVKLLDKDGDQCNRASKEYPHLGCSYTVKSIPEPEPEPEQGTTTTDADLRAAISKQGGEMRKVFALIDEHGEIEVKVNVTLFDGRILLDTDSGGFRIVPLAQNQLILEVVR